MGRSGLRASCGEKGLLANAFENDSLSAVEFYRFGRSKQAGDAPSLPPGYDEAKDPFLLRHFHPPLVVYLTAAAGRAFGPTNERGLRTQQLLAVAFIAALLATYRQLSESPTWAGLVIVSTTAYWLSLVLFSSLSMHGWIAVWIAVAPALTVRWLNARDARTGLLLCACLAFSMLTLETGVAIILGVFLSLALWGSKSSLLLSRVPWRDTLIGTAVMALIILAIWPGGFLKLSLAIAMHIYRLRLGLEYAVVQERAGGTFLVLYAPIMLAVGTTLVLFTKLRGNMRQWGPFFILGLITFLLMLKFAISPLYLAPD